MYQDAIAAFIGAGLLLLVGVLLLTGRDVPGQLWGFLGTAVGYFLRGGQARSGEHGDKRR